MSGHRDWVRSMALSHHDDCLLSGSMDGVVNLWDVGRLTVTREMLVAGSTTMNSIQSLAFNANETCLGAVTREGVLCGFDLRTSQSLFSSVTPIQFPCHTEKANNLQFSEDGYHLLTSGRDSSIHLWDLRRLGPGSTPIQTYGSHICQMYPISAKFLYNGRFIVTGSEDNAAYVYAVVDGTVARKVEMACPVTQTEPTSDYDLSFYVILYRNQRLGLVDVAGKDVELELPSIDEQRREKIKSAMQTTLWELSNQIFQHLRVIGRHNMVGYGNLLEALQTTAQTDPGSQQLLAQIQDRYERKLAHVCVQLPRISGLFSTTQKGPRQAQTRSFPNPEIQVERSGSEPCPAYFPSEY